MRTLYQKLCQKFITYLSAIKQAFTQTTAQKKRLITETELIHYKYRADIDGLRAIAVLSVVGYHAFPTWIKGGFIGVDIFFVISGFLISTIIFENLRRGSFSFIEFYSRRIKRIFPALITVMLACFIFGWLILLPDEYKQLNEHIAAGSGFISNFTLWKESGYFDNLAATKPLLHLWSLGIEEQFYIVWPLLLWAIYKKKLNWLTVITVITIVSFILNIYSVHTNIVAAFYSPQTRFWELLIGSALAYTTLYKQNTLSKMREIIYKHTPETNGCTLGNIQSLLGLTLIILGMALITKEKYFPGAWALLPTLGAALIISAGSKAWFNRTILANRLLVWFGLISFPLYLWHWPILSFAQIIKSESLPRIIRISALVLSIILSWLTYQLIEKPIRFRKSFKGKTAILLALMIALGNIGYYTYKNNGFDFRIKDRQEFINFFENDLPKWNFFTRENILEKYRNDCNFYNLDLYRNNKATNIPIKTINQSCYMRDFKKPKAIFIWGDSHAQQLYYGLNKNLPNDWQILQVASSGCHPDIGKLLNPKKHYCQKSNDFALNTIKLAKPLVVIIAQRSGHDPIKSKEILQKLKNIGVKYVIFMGPVPLWQTDLPKIIARQLWFLNSNRTFTGIDKELLITNDSLKIQFEKNNLIYIDLISFFCNKEGCLTRIGNNKMKDIVTYDYGHLLPIASDYLAKKLLVPKIMAITTSISPGV